MYNHFLKSTFLFLFISSFGYSQEIQLVSPDNNILVSFKNESPLTVVCDHPDNILNQPGSDFLKVVPTTWDDTHFIDGYPGDYIAIARRNKNSWFVGVMNNSIEKEIPIKLDFIPKGEHQIVIWADAEDVNVSPKNLEISSQKVKQGDFIRIKMAKNGGWVAKIN